MRGTPLVVLAIASLVLGACGDADTAATKPTATPSTVLSSDGAQVILRNHLVKCLQRFEDKESKIWWEDLAAGKYSPWSAYYEETVQYTKRERNGEERSVTEERWIVKGAGLEHTRDGKLGSVTGTWRVVAGDPRPTPLDGPALLAEEQFKALGGFLGCL